MSVTIDELYEQFVLASEEDQLFIKEELADPSNKDDEGEEEETPYIPINPMVEIKLEGEEEEPQYDEEEGDMVVEEVPEGGSDGLSAKNKEGVVQ